MPFEKLGMEERGQDYISPLINCYLKNPCFSYDTELDKQFKDTGEIVTASLSVL